MPPGIDVRGHGTGYTLLPPSTHEQGRYVWKDATRPGAIRIAPAPKWLLDYLKPKEEPVLKTAPLQIGFSQAEIPKPALDTYRLSNRIRTAILQPPDINSDRSAIDQSVITALLKAGANNDEIRAVFEHYPIGTQGKFAEKGSHALRYLQHSIMRAREYLAMAPDTGRAITDLQDNPSVPPVEIDEDVPPVDTALIEHCLQDEEFGDGRLLAEVYKDRLIFDHSEREWFMWAGHSWQCDTTKKIRLLYSGQVAGQYLQASARLRKEADALESKSQEYARTGDNLDETMREQVNKKRSLGNAMINRTKLLRYLNRTDRALKFAASFQGITGERWDNQPLLLPVSNGVVNLESGQLLSGNPSDYLRTVAPTEWTGLHTPAPRWEQFMLEIMDGDEEMVAFLQRLFGYGLSGLTTEHVFPILWGEQGRNGKDTLLETLAFTLGDLAGAATKDTIIDSGGRRASGSAEPHIYDLQGKRLVWASEPRVGARLNAAQVKLITGGGRLKARPLYGQLVEWEPTHLVMLVCNPRPHIAADDSALWSRILLVPFTQRFVDNPTAANEHQADRDLKYMLRAETSGVLAWLVRGFLQWRRVGLKPPALVKLATSEYRKNEDTLERFLKERCVIDDNAKVKASDLSTAYQIWCSENGIRNQLDGRSFGEKMGRTFERKHTRGGNVYFGVGVLPR